MDAAAPVKLGVLTSGGDAQGMNAAVRAVVRTARYFGAVPYAIYEGWQGAVDGGDAVHEMTWDEVGSIIWRGGTIIGTARSKDFRERAGMLRAAKNLLDHGIDRLVVIGGDGSLTGTDIFRREWPALLAELVAAGEITQSVADRHPSLMIAGLVGSIDNDLVGTDSTIGADSALHRILEAIDALTSTAASHQRSFVIEVMGRHCGYLPLMAAIAGGCDYVLVPELPPADGWEEVMCQSLRRGRAAGRRDSLVVVAEGARDRHGNAIRAHDVMNVIQERMGEDTRVTILGHVQRGGRASAYDRWMSTVLGYHAVVEVLNAKPEDPAHILGIRENRVARLPLVESIQNTRAVADHIEVGRFRDAVKARGGSFGSMLQMFGLLSEPPEPDAPTTGKRIAIMHIGGLAPGMNAAVRAAVRLGIACGHTMLGVNGSVKGLMAGQVRELSWGDVDSWMVEGGADLGTRRTVPELEDFYPIGRALENNQVDALIIVGGFRGYRTARALVAERDRYPAFRMPIVCIPASIDNNLPGSELSIGTDSALNAAVEALDKIKQSASATTRAVVAEIMGRSCGYLTLMSGLAVGAERVYLHERGVTLPEIEEDVRRAVESFRDGRRFFLALRNEQASEYYTTDVLARLFEAESEGLFTVRQSTLGHLQQGADPSPFDRILATRLAAYAIDDVTKQFVTGRNEAKYVGLVGGGISALPLRDMADHVEADVDRPLEQWWLEMEPVLEATSDADARPADISEVQRLISRRSG